MNDIDKAHAFLRTLMRATQDAHERGLLDGLVVVAISLTFEDGELLVATTPSTDALECSLLLHGQAEMLAEQAKATVQ